MKEYTMLLDDGFRVGVTEGGAGTPLVFLHGLGVSAPAYTEMLELLAANGFEVIAFDAPNHGRSDSLPFGHTVADMTDIIAQALELLGVEKAIMVGHSMGGGMVVEFAARYPGRVHTAILLNAAAGEEHHNSIRIDRSAFAPLRAAQYFAGAFRDLAGDVGQAVQKRSRRDNLRLLKTLRRSVSGPRALKAAYALMRADTGCALRWMRAQGVRTVVVHGTEDGIVPQLAAVSAWKLSGGRIILLGGRFHSWMLVDPELAVEIIRNSVRSLVEVG